MKFCFVFLLIGVYCIHAYQSLQKSITKVTNKWQLAPSSSLVFQKSSVTRLCYKVNGVDTASSKEATKELKPDNHNKEVKTGRHVKSNDLELLFDKALDTIEDIALHLKRMVFSPPPKTGKQRVIVLGSGWSAHSFLKVIDTNMFDVVCISPRPFFIFTPMLASTAVGTVEYRSIVENIRAANPTIDYIEGEATSIKSENQLQVTTKLVGDTEMRKLSVPYDYLIYSVGSKVADFGVTGVRQYCCFIKEVDDVRKIKQKIFNCFEKASLPDATPEQIEQLLTFVIVGGGPTGVEFTGELSDFIREEVSRMYPRLLEQAKIVLLNSAGSILSAFDTVLQQKALQSLRSEGIDIRLKTRVTEVQETSVRYKTTLPGTNSPVEINLPFGMCVWAAGNAPREITSSFAQYLGQAQEESVRKTGRIAVDGWLRVKRAPLQAGKGASAHNPRVFAMGDVSRIEEVGEADKGAGLPQTAQVAGQQGAYVARLLNRGYNLSTETPSIPSSKWDSDPTHAVAYRLMQGLRLRGALEAKPFQFLNLGLLAYVGDSEAVVQVQLGNSTLIDAAGNSAFLLWRSVYLVKQVSVRTRVLVLFDFIKTKVFGRDLTTV